VYSYMKYAESKLREEEQRALKYLETAASGVTASGCVPEKYYFHLKFLTFK